MPERSEPSRTPGGPLLGCIADDVTGATDLAGNLAAAGLESLLVLEDDSGRLPVDPRALPETTPVIVAGLKIRSLPAGEAMRRALEALETLVELGCRQFYFKYCSTFDSTDEGNIGPVAIALRDALGAPRTLFCPAYPRTGRTTYLGHHFVNGRLLSESGMESHPLTPMRDPDLVRVLGRQVSEPVSLLPHSALHGSPERVRESLDEISRRGSRLTIADALDEAQLELLARAVRDWPLLTGGAGLAHHLPVAWRDAGLVDLRRAPLPVPSVSCRTLILCGSCSRASREQVERLGSRVPCWSVDVEAVLRDREKHLEQAVTWYLETSSSRSTHAVSSAAAPDIVNRLQEEHGAERVAETLEDFHARLATALVREHGVRRLIVAGGETSGAVVSRLGGLMLRVGVEIAPGVPWMESVGEPALALCLKSGNFGGPDFFERALERLP